MDQDNPQTSRPADHPITSPFFITNNPNSKILNLQMLIYIVYGVFMLIQTIFIITMLAGLSENCSGFLVYFILLIIGNAGMVALCIFNIQLIRSNTQNPTNFQLFSPILVWFLTALMRVVFALVFNYSKGKTIGKCFFTPKYVNYFIICVIGEIILFPILHMILRKSLKVKYFF